MLQVLLSKLWDIQYSKDTISDSADSRTLRVASFTDVTGMTIESCLAFCTPAGYKFAGLEFARVCYTIY